MHPRILQVFPQPVRNEESVTVGHHLPETGAIMADGVAQRRRPQPAVSCSGKRAQRPPGRVRAEVSIARDRLCGGQFCQLTAIVLGPAKAPSPLPSPPRVCPR